VFADLLAHPGVQERVELRSSFGFLAFHAGLEGGTEEIATAAAAASGASVYVVAQPADLRWHVPSHQIDPAVSPALEAFLSHVEVAVSIHGYGRPDRPRQLLLGGRNRDLAAHVAGHLRHQVADFEVIDELDDVPSEMRGLHPRNPVNLPRGGGVQIELPPRARGASPRPSERGQPCIPAPGLVDALAAAVTTWAGSITA
jgi:phage replication-related protein YjqB (UPF0714/DUF867 family)